MTQAFSWDLPNPFICSVCPGEGDIDGLNHTNNAVYVQWCESVAWAHSGSLGLSLETYQALDRGMAIQRAEYAYLLPSFLGERLLLGTWLVATDGRFSLTRRFQLVRESDGAVVLRGSWQLVCIELSTGKARRFPDAFVQGYLPAIVPAPVQA